MRFVLDTSVLVAASRSKTGASRKILELGLENKFEWLISVPLFLEYEDVLCRAEHLEASGSTHLKVNRLLDRILLQSKRISLDEHVRVNLGDPDDEHVLALALQGRADAVVTHNLRHFASLPRDFGIRLWTPGRALGAIGGNHEQLPRS